jgi:glycerol kinase
VWHDTRTLNIVEKINKINNNDKEAYKELTGLPCNTYFSAVKIKWMIENVEEIKNKIVKKNYENLCFGTIDSWIIYVMDYLKLIIYRN